MTATNAAKPAGSGTKPRATRPLPPREAPGDDASVPALPEVPGGVLNFTTRPAAERTEQRSVLFRIDGKEYTVLDNPPASLGLEYLDRIRMGGLSAVPWAMEVMLGAGGFAALKECKDIPQEGLNRVVEVVTEKLVGSMEPPKKA